MASNFCFLSCAIPHPCGVKDTTEKDKFDRIAWISTHGDLVSLTGQHKDFVMKVWGDNTDDYYTETRIYGGAYMIAKGLLMNWDGNVTKKYFKVGDEINLDVPSGTITMKIFELQWAPPQYDRILLEKVKVDYEIESEEALSADFSIEPSQNINLGDFVTVDASSSTGDIVSYKWDFGDGIKNDGIVDFDGTELDLSFHNKQVRHLFRSTGTFSVTLTIRDPNGNLDDITKTLTVAAKYKGAVLNISEAYEKSEQSYSYHAVYIKYAPAKIKVEKYSNTAGISGVEVGSAVKHDVKKFFDFYFFAGMVAQKGLFEGAKVVGYRITPLVGHVLTLKSFIDFVEFIRGYNFFVAEETNLDGIFEIHIPYETAESGDMKPDNLQFQKTPEQLIYVSKPDIGLSEDTDQKFAYMKKIDPSALPEGITFYYEPLKKEETEKPSLSKLKISVKREIYRHSPVLKPKHLKDVPLIGVPIRVDGKDIGSTSSGGVLEVTEADLNKFGISPFGSHSLEAGDGTFYSKKTVQFDFTHERTTYVNIVLDKCKLPDTPSYATIIIETPTNYPDLVIYPHAKSIENFITNKGILAEDLHAYDIFVDAKSIISGSDWVVVLFHSENVDKDYRLHNPGGFLSYVDTNSKKHLRNGSGWQIIRYDYKSVDTEDILQHVYCIVYSEDKTDTVEAAVKEFFEIMEQELGGSGELDQLISASINCSANLHAYDSQGRHVGVSVSGGIDLEIPDASYTGPDSEPESIIIPNQSDNIIFKVEALDTGEFDFTLTQSTGTKTTIVTYLDVPIIQTTEATVDVSEANPTYTLNSASRRGYVSPNTS